MTRMLLMCHLFLIVASTAYVLPQSDENLQNTTKQEKYNQNIIDYLFSKYGAESILLFEGYEHLLHSIKLGKLVFDHNLTDHKKRGGSGFNEFHVTHDHAYRKDNNKDEHTHTHLSNSEHKHEYGVDSGHAHEYGDDSGHAHEHGNSPQSQKGNNRQKRSLDTLSDVKKAYEKCLMPKEILDLYGYSIELGLTQQQFVEICPAIIVQLDAHKCEIRKTLAGHNHGQETVKNRKSNAVWGYGCAAIAVISVSGLAAVGAISAVHKLSVGGILHFFVSLAVGALTGDAFLHLLPHAYESAQHEHTEGSSEYGHGIDGVLKGLCGLGVMIFFFLIGRIQGIVANTKQRKKLKAADTDFKFQYTEEVTVLNDKYEKIDNLLKDLEECSSASPKSPDMLLSREHHSDSGHGHSHGYDEPPTTAGAMVWRVIIGDGIHNFSDGLAIGVAFTDSVTGGMSTAIAVLCHELPHEMGDFAVLLKKGMSIKKAMMYNCLSSFLSLVGALVGIAVGNIQSVNLYVFVCIAAMFVYISLVDMVPEISDSTGEKPFRQLLIQMCGIMFGCLIMLVIALKEDALKKILDD